ncbi:hypothetical protein GLOTRDRAFT_139821 [Gloeophyllum trabeum ATCC 11539]|uniref:Uncharacterized protein n=1 Tax=Gloeophyllum trabeum (strain ATCC 11539 / FP-39264 / Madison 617) TaxID=670483 RepID=S7RLT5_GLOTA|nr:uncharacterized protein GLOTRDRAFT_139821 [Gloeophyllum trabeum ATCC 11539]EPQ53664.1 hypothetical protein GLOTRDRAFT_139821 [Gloeophyllum trabeum ATCC 11539]
MPPPSAVPERRLARSASARYPSHLARDGRVRVPLATRTDTYERLEDLLREAGYKETRVFTPETERYDEEGKTEGRGARGMGAVVSFISGFMRPAKEEKGGQGDSGDKSEGSSALQGGPSPPTALSRSTSSRSSLDHARSSHASSPKSDYIDITSPRRAARQAPHANVAAYDQLDYLHRQLPHSRPKPHNAHSQPLPQSRARAYLRHMASAPNMPQRRAAPAHTPSQLHQSQSFSDVEDEPTPPLPSTWLEAVAKAVLGSGVPGAHAGRPTAHTSLGRAQSKTKSKRSHSALSDRTNARALPTIMLPRSQSSTAPVVCTTQVMCQSAPGSRCPSRANSIKSLRRGRDSVKRSRNTDRDRLPSLASTRVEGDMLALYLEGDGKVRASEDAELDDSSDEEGEIDLARLLVPPRRQNSIKSLRRHLHREESLTRLSRANVRARAPKWDEENDGFVWGVRDGEAEEERWGTFERSGSKRRRAIPNGWVQWTGSRA